MCELLGIEQSVLERAFSFRTVEAKMEKVSTTLNVAQVSTHTLLVCRTNSFEMEKKKKSKFLSFFLNIIQSLWMTGGSLIKKYCKD